MTTRGTPVSNMPTSMPRLILATCKYHGQGSAQHLLVVKYLMLTSLHMANMQLAGTKGKAAMTTDIWKGACCIEQKPARYNSQDMCNGAGGLECDSMIRQDSIALQREHRGMSQYFRALKIFFWVATAYTIIFSLLRGCQAGIPASPSKQRRTSLTEMLQTQRSASVLWQPLW